MGLLDKVKEKTSNLDVAGQVSKAKEATASLTDATNSKVRDLCNQTLLEVNSMKPVLEKSGFIVGDMVITMSIPPAVKIVVEQTSKGEQSLEDLDCDADEFTGTQKTILRGLKQAYSMNDLVDPHGYVIGQVEMEMTFPPKVHVHLNSKDSRAFG